MAQRMTVSGVVVVSKATDKNLLLLGSKKRYGKESWMSRRFYQQEFYRNLLYPHRILFYRATGCANILKNLLYDSRHGGRMFQLAEDDPSDSGRVKRTYGVG